MYLGKFGKNPITSLEDNVRTPYYGHSKCRFDHENLAKGTKKLCNFPLIQKMYLCKFGQNQITCSEDDAWKPYFGHFKVPL